MGEANSSPVQAYMTYPVPYQANEPVWHLPTHSTHLRIHTSTRPSRGLLYPLLMRRSYIYSSLLVTHPNCSRIPLIPLSPCLRRLSLQ